MIRLFRVDAVPPSRTDDHIHDVVIIAASTVAHSYFRDFDK